MWHVWLSEVFGSIDYFSSKIPRTAWAAEISILIYAIIFNLRNGVDSFYLFIFGRTEVCIISRHKKGIWYFSHSMFCGSTGQLQRIWFSAIEPKGLLCTSWNLLDSTLIVNCLDTSCASTTCSSRSCCPLCPSVSWTSTTPALPPLPPCASLTLPHRSIPARKPRQTPSGVDTAASIALARP